jgi:RNA polymerase sigma-70 factor (ECF subfamily)
LIELLRSFKTYKAMGSLTAWTDRITVRVTLRRQKLARQTRLVTIDEALDAPALSGSPWHDYLTRRQLVQWLDGIPAEQRHALILHHVVGMSIPEMAEELGVSPETVRSRLRLAIGKLRAQEKTFGGRP